MVKHEKLSDYQGVSTMGQDGVVAYLKRIGYIRKIIPNTCPDCYSVRDFCKEYPKGKYLLAMGNHTVTVIDGDYYDTWDSGNEVPIYYWTKD